LLATTPSPSFKIPQSVLVVIYTPALDVLLIERSDSPGFWQSVTGSKDTLNESWASTASREVHEETGIDATASNCTLTDWQFENVYDIYPHYRHRYAPGVTRNTERVFGLLVPQNQRIVLNPIEHLAWRWLPWREAAAACGSASNALAIEQLPARAQFRI
jgi:dihydroneopterin triphosphate diphosphatase